MTAIILLSIAGRTNGVEDSLFFIDCYCIIDTEEKKQQQTALTRRFDDMENRITYTVEIALNSFRVLNASVTRSLCVGMKHALKCVDTFITFQNSQSNRFPGNS